MPSDSTVYLTSSTFSYTDPLYDTLKVDTTSNNVTITLGTNTEMRNYKFSIHHCASSTTPKICTVDASGGALISGKTSITIPLGQSLAFVRGVDGSDNPVWTVYDFKMINYSAQGNLTVTNIGASEVTLAFPTVISNNNSCVTVTGSNTFTVVNSGQYRIDVSCIAIILDIVSRTLRTRIYAGTTVLAKHQLRAIVATTGTVTMFYEGPLLAGDVITVKAVSGAAAAFSVGDNEDNASMAFSIRRLSD